MKKNMIIGLLCIVAAMSLLYNFYLKDQSDRLLGMLVENQRTAEEMHAQSTIKMEEAVQQLALTNSQLAETMRQLQIAQEELNKIKRPK
jgi:hypothetical protein